MYARQSLGLAYSLAEESRRRASEDRRSRDAADARPEVVGPRPAPLRLRVARLLRPTASRTGAAG
jgi:hypothetical protein